MRIVTAGSTYLDIDAYAGCIAYAELLQKLDIEAQAVSTAILNQSIPPIVRSWNAPLHTTYTPSAADTFILVDISDPNYFEKFVDQNRISEVIDHRPGHEAYWQERIGDRALIELVGAACTQIFKLWEQAGIADHVSETSARLLMCGILDNTLNFTADSTTKRDRYAYNELAKHAGLPNDWPARYFGACQKAIMKNIADSLAADTKVITFKTYPHPLAIGQFAVWDAKDAVRQSEAVCKKVLGHSKADWFVNIIGIKDNKSYLVSEVPAVKIWLADLLGVQFDGNLATANRSWLRKEIMKADINKSAK